MAGSSFGDLTVAGYTFVANSFTASSTSATYLVASNDGSSYVKIASLQFSVTQDSSGGTDISVCQYDARYWYIN